MIVMQDTIDFLIKDKRIKEINKLMGDNLPWEQKETETKVKYVVKEFNVLKQIQKDIESELADLDK